MGWDGVKSLSLVSVSAHARERERERPGQEKGAEMAAKPGTPGQQQLGSPGTRNTLEENVQGGVAAVGVWGGRVSTYLCLGSFW